jgi:hypothetical protein
MARNCVCVFVCLFLSVSREVLVIKTPIASDEV